MKYRKLRVAAIILCGLLMAFVPGLDMAVQRRARPDATDSFGLVYQTIAYLETSQTMDSVSMTVMFAVFAWLCARYLFRKPRSTGMGEYVLCAFFSGMTLLAAAIRAEATMQTLYADGFQVIKCLVYLAGMFPLFLVGLRGLNDLLLGKVDIGENRLSARLRQSPFWYSFLVLGIAWFPHIIIKYPGVLMWDSYAQIKQFFGEWARVSNHPPFGTLLYGLVASLGMALGNINLGYFFFILVQVLCFIAVLSYSLAVMHRRVRVRWVPLLTLTLYALSPCYVGWVTVIAKDTSYLILCLLAGALLMEFSLGEKAFLSQWKKPTLLAACLSLMVLTRHNGILIAGAVFTAILIILLVQRGGRGQWVRFLTVAVAAAVVTVGANEALVRGLAIKEVYLYDVLSLPFQQTARVVKLHGDELPPEEAQAIDRVLRYDVIGDVYNEWYADAVKDTYRQEATAGDRRAYFAVWLRQLMRYPVEYADAALHMNAVLFDLQSNRPMYISMSDMDINEYVYPYSFNDMSMYNREETVPLHSAQRALTQWYFDFSGLPVIGPFASMGFCVDVMLVLLYLAWVNKRRKALLAWIPALITFAGCLLSPVVYLRYALPIVCGLPLWIGGYVSKGAEGC